MGCWCTFNYLRNCRVLPNTNNLERNSGSLVVKVEPFLMESAVGAKKITVVSGAKQYCFTFVSVCDCLTNPVKRCVYLKVETVVKVSVFLFVFFVHFFQRSCGPVAGVVGMFISDLCCRFSGKILMTRWRFRNIWR